MRVRAVCAVSCTFAFVRWFVVVVVVVIAVVVFLCCAASVR